MALIHSILITLILTSVAYVTSVLSFQNNDIRQLPFCDHSNAEIDSKRLVFVSTLDGKLTALNVNDGGVKTWSISTGPGPMLSSSIHRLELTNNGHWVRMIPSLSGGLYKFNGEHIEPVPITVDNLLKSSFKYSDDLVISGGKESRTYGVDLQTGRVIYECSMNRCDNLTESYSDFPGDVVLIQRQTQTVRAVEPRSGSERWNFSVGQHDLKIAPNPSADCHNNVEDSIDIQLKVIVPDGLICAVSKSKPNQIIWKHKFDFPVASAWEKVGGALKWVNLFGGIQSMAGEEIPNSPALYVGMHNKQLYIQESVQLQRKILESIHSDYPLLSDESSRVIPSIPWKPIRASGKALGIEGNNEPILQITDETSGHSTTALSVLYGSEYVNGYGFFLYTAEAIEEKNTALCKDKDKVNITILISDSSSNNENEMEEDDETPVTIIIVSMWYWWKEIVLLSVSSAIGINIILQRKFFAIMRQRSKVAMNHRDSGVIINDDNILRRGELLRVSSQKSEEYVSRYLTDFEPIHCLGKGGFGVVFQAKNKIDDCHYAIKRIPLPNKEHARTRVMREVKALAKLDHQNIVRYFNSWIECPPPDWQAEQDSFWSQLSSDDGVVTVDLTGGVTPVSEMGKQFIDGTSHTSAYRRKNGKKSTSELLESFVHKATSFFRSYSFKKRTESSNDDSSFIQFENTDESGGLKQKNVIEASVKLSDSQRVLHNSKIKRPTTLEVTSDAEASPGARVYLYIQMQLCKKDSLREWLACNMQMRSPDQIIPLFSQIIKAVEYVHLQGLIHRDLKPSNIFFSPEGQIKVGDFGLVTGMIEGCEEARSPMSYTNNSPFLNDDIHTARVGTQLYMSPEQLEGQSYNYKVDIFSLGLILFELLVPFTTQMERITTLSEVRKNVFPPNFKETFPNEYELLKLMLCKDPENRLTTIGIRFRKPLIEFEAPFDTHEEESHFYLPNVRHRNDSSSKSSSQDS